MLKLNYKHCLCEQWTMNKIIYTVNPIIFLETHFKCPIHLFSCHMHALDSQVPNSFVLSRPLGLLSLILICSFQWGRPSPLSFKSPSSRCFYMISKTQYTSNQLICSMNVIHEHKSLWIKMILWYIYFILWGESKRIVYLTSRNDEQL